MKDASRYTIAVRKADIDGETIFEAKVREFPDVAAYGATHGEAYDAALDAVQTLVESAEESKAPIPEPFAEEESASGRVTLRLPKSLHARAAENAKSEEVSLNAYLTALIAEGVGMRAGINWSASDPIRIDWPTPVRRGYMTVRLIEPAEDYGAASGTREVVVVDRVSAIKGGTSMRTMNQATAGSYHEWWTGVSVGRD